MSKQTELKDPQQISFIGKLENQAYGAAMILIIENSKKKNFFWVFSKFCKRLIKMETQTFVNILNSSENEYSRFATKKWYVIDSESKRGSLYYDPIKF